MSFAIGLVGSNFTIIAADTRGTKIVDCGTVKAGTHTDDRRKVFPTQFGWIAAHGGVVLGGQYFAENLKISGATEIEDIYLNWIHSHKRVENFIEAFFKNHISEADRKKVRAELPSSAAIISMNKFIDGEYKLSFNTFDYGFDIRTFDEPGTMYVSNPTRTRKITRIANRYGKLEKLYKCRRKPFDMVYSLGETNNLQKAIYIISCLMANTSKITNSVSGIVDMGISLRVSPDEVLLMSIHGSTEELKKIYEAKQDYSEIMIVCGTLTNKGDKPC